MLVKGPLKWCTEWQIATVIHVGDSVQNYEIFCLSVMEIWFCTKAYIWAGIENQLHNRCKYQVGTRAFGILWAVIIEKIRDKYENLLVSILDDN